MPRAPHLALCACATATFLLADPDRSSAQPPAISGMVRHAKSGKPIECLHVALADSLDRTVAHTVTGADGTFVVVAPDTGSYRVRFILPGVEPRQGPLLRMTAGMMTEDLYPLSFDEALGGEFDALDRRRAPSIDLGEWQSATVRGGKPGRGSMRVSEGEMADVSARASDIARVVAELIVDADGRPRPSSWRPIVASNPALAQSARSSYLGMRFEPARIGQQPVCELQLAEVRSFRADRVRGRP